MRLESATFLAMLTAENLRFRYARSSQAALDGLTLSVPKGSLYGLLGPNGSGKTTFLSLLAGVLRPQEGRIHLAPETRVALVPQEYAFYPRLSVAENLRFFAELQGFTGARRFTRVATALAATGLEEHADLRAERCSGGMKRRLNLAIGLLGEPELLLLDEPTVGIDPQSRAFILELVRGLPRRGCTVIYTTHYMDEVQQLCERIALLDHGRVLREGPLAELLNDGGSGTLEALFLQLTRRELRD